MYAVLHFHPCPCIVNPDISYKLKIMLMIIFNLFLNGGKKLWNKIFGHVSRPRLEIHACSNPSLLVSEHCFNMKNFGDT